MLLLISISILLIIGSLRGSGEEALPAVDKWRNRAQQTGCPSPNFYLAERIAAWIQGIVGMTLCAILLCCALASVLGY